MRYIAAAIVVATIAVPGNAAAQHRRSFCRTSDGNGWSNADVKQAIRCANSRWHVPGGYPKARSVARCESGFNEHNYYAGNAGVFQQRVRYWRGRYRRLNPHHGWKLGPSVYNARTNIVISIRMAHGTGWGDWSCA